MNTQHEIEIRKKDTVYKKADKEGTLVVPLEVEQEDEDAQVLVDGVDITGKISGIAFQLSSDDLCTEVSMNFVPSSVYCKLTAHIFPQISGIGYDALCILLDHTKKSAERMGIHPERYIEMMYSPDVDRCRNDTPLNSVLPDCLDGIKQVYLEEPQLTEKDG